VQATREIKRHAPETAVLILSMYSDEHYVHNAMEGARKVTCSRTRLMWTCRKLA